MKYICSLSGGVSSAIATDRAIEKYGRDNVVVWFADTSWEDDDLYRFIGDCMKRWGGELVTYRDGRTPLEVATDVKIVPNNRIAPCTRILKIEPFVKYIKENFGPDNPVTILLGLDYTEVHRMKAPKANYEALGEWVKVDYPLMWKPYEMRNYFDVVRDDWGVEVPRLYQRGYPHNNCGGRCVKQGQREWLRTLHYFPEQFCEVADWEKQQQAAIDTEYTILKRTKNGQVEPLSLYQLAKESEEESAGQMSLFDDGKLDDDMFACFCSY